MKSDKNQKKLFIWMLNILFNIKHSKIMLPFLFKDDGNPNLYGYIFNSILFASMFYVLLKVAAKLPK